MPYIPSARRDLINYRLDPPMTAGELNFALTREIERFRANRGDSYQTFNDIIGALEGAKQEFYRRVVAPYEDAKREQNGDVYADSE